MRPVALLAALFAVSSLLAVPARAQGRDPVQFRTQNTNPREVWEVRVREAVTTQRTRLMAAWQNGDQAALSELFAKNGELELPDGEKLGGRREIRFSSAQLLREVRAVQMETVSLFIAGERATEVGTLTLTLQEPGGEPHLETYTYVLVFRRGYDFDWPIAALRLGDMVG